MNQPRAYEGNEPYIFVSYAHKDSDRVLPIISALQDRGFRVWYYSEKNPNADFQEIIAQHLDGCSSFLAIISQNALDSFQCRQEINFVIELKKEPAVVYLEDVKMSLGMRMQLGSLQAMYRNRHATMELFLNELYNSNMLAKCRDKNMRAGAAFNSSVGSYRSIRERAESGDVTAQYNLATLFANGDGVPQSWDEAVKWFTRAAERGLAEAQYMLGKCYSTAKGVTPNYYEAARWFQKAAEQGIAAAQCDFGACYFSGLGVVQNYFEAVKWYQKAADQGYALAQSCLGSCYMYGQGVAANIFEAVRLFRLATEQEDAMGMYCLGALYAGGIGVPQDVNEALRLVKESAEKGYAPAQIEMANDCNSRGAQSEAVLWMRKAAEQGVAYAQYQLAVDYHYGWGVEKDEAEAIVWYRKAAQQGHTPSIEALRKMGQT